MSESAQKVLHELTSAGLLSSDQATDYGVELQTGTEALLSKLQADGRITAYQAQKFREGRPTDIYFGDYVVIDKLGQGGMGTVLKARHRRMDREVAIKVLPVTVLESQDAVARFYQEVKVAAQLTHPNIVVSYDAGEHHGFHYLVMEYVPGHDLAEVLSTLGPMPLALVLDYIVQAAKGLDYAHRKGIVHRDIKPSNLLLNDEGQVKILDMGLARLGNTINQEATQLTTTGQVMGTVEYMSPEQAEDTRQADERSDMYSLGCTLFRLLTGRSPFSRDTVVKTILAHRSDPIPVIDNGHPDDELANRLFQKMVAKKPEQRFQTMAALIEAIESGGDESAFADSAESGPAPQLNLAPASLLTPPVATAFVERFDSRLGVDALPEAIIPDVASGPVDYISEASLASTPITPATSSSGSVSEVIYIPDVPPVRGPFRRFRQWLRGDRSKGILLWSLIALVGSAFPFVGLLVGWFNWRAASQDLRDIKRGIRDPRCRARSLWGRRLSMLATAIGFVMTIVWLAGGHFLSA